MSDLVKCNSGHESPRAIWDCPVCTNKLREEHKEKIEALSELVKEKSKEVTRWHVQCNIQCLAISKVIEEVKCLRSVLSEWDEDKSCYVQWLRAEDLRIERKNLN